MSTGDPSSDGGYAKRILIARAKMFLLLGLISLNILIWMRDRLPPEEVVFMAIITGLLLGGAVVTYVAVYMSSGNKKRTDSSNRIYICKHCGERFENEKIKNRHERSCPKMRI